MKTTRQTGPDRRLSLRWIYFKSQRIAGVVSALYAASANALGDTSVDPLREAKNKKAIVLFFVATDCPVSNAYAPEIRRIEAEYGPRGMGFYSVYPDPAQTLANARKHAAQYGLPNQVLLDPAHRLTHKTGATVTPEAAVLSSGGKLLYRGRIDDLYVGFGKRREVATRHDLRLALDAILRGESAPQPFTKSVGCYIPDAAPATTRAATH